MKKKDLSKRDKRRQGEGKIIKERVNVLSRNVLSLS